MVIINKGQIVEIPATSPLYRMPQPEFSSKKEMLCRYASRAYSLFDGFLVGEHSGTENFILGQRKGINVGGKKAPLYVIGIDRAENRLFVGEGEMHPGLWTSVLAFAENALHWHGDLQHTEDSVQGIAVEVSSSVMDNVAAAVLYVFGTEVFLEFEQPVSIAVQDHPFTITHHHNIIAEKK
ncbi:MAG: hypothetical protein L6264_05005 [Weeksellaceae bacterium]|nr:hypothetical protein [Bacteroidota bacterium]MCG2780288.1 hypothetical protein [Weeksellaceae bacterium]